MIQPTFQPVSFSWVALHPKPKGVIQFIGGAFFGTFPTLFYRHLLQELYREGYTLVALPFRFSLRHWQIAYSLLEEQHQLRQILPELAEHQGYDSALYRDVSSYLWFGHSLGCKYIALLELLSGDEAAVAAALPEDLVDTYHRSPGIWSQGSVLLAPDISDLESAIPIRSLVALLNRLHISVQPDRQQTLDLIQQSALFNLTAMMSFDRDTVAGSLCDLDPGVSDVLWLAQYLQTKSAPVQELSGKHLEPIGWRIGRYIADFNPLDKFIKALVQWQVHDVTCGLLQSLQQILPEKPADWLPSQAYPC
ncbi:DUF1350 family protein [Nodosilinea sp. LEGE 07298]|uniref:DUF1350 family protein n=1 Tax=Nodosilinea sp. LEGE 07298 TaxID=2777970 RepID=UPI0018820EF5|nr:DUF1350 family protein [Nodosilinea sp. LEGE 07298]MBE9112742.1 DUF1350 family protein [Nodosilinea sp. LEGE 07298]